MVASRPAAMGQVAFLASKSTVSLKVPARGGQNSMRKSSSRLPSSCSLQAPKAPSSFSNVA